MNSPLSPSARPIEILLVEDNPGDVRLTEEAFKEGRVYNRLSVAGDGVEALAFLRREGRYAEAPRPDLVLLDLNLPKKSGREVLAEIKADPRLRHLPVVVLTTSSAEEDICRSYDLDASCYVTKPVDLDRFISVVKAINEFWFAVVRSPAEGGEVDKGGERGTQPADPSGAGAGLPRTATGAAWFPDLPEAKPRPPRRGGDAGPSGGGGGARSEGGSGRGVGGESGGPPHG